MNKTAFALLAVLIALPVILPAIEYELNSYQVPEYQEGTLSLALNNSGSLGKEYAKEFSEAGNDLKASFSEILYTRKQSLVLKGSLDIHNFLKLSAADDTTNFTGNETNFKPDLEISGQYRYYFLKNCFIDTYLADSYIKKYRYIDNTNISKESEEKNDFINIELICEPGLGYGRRQDVAKARQALYILEELEAVDLLLRKANTDDVTSLADLLVSLQHLRLFDSRLKNQEALREIVNHLTAAGLIEETNIENFLIINDMYMFGAGYPRVSGWDIKAMMRITSSQDENHDTYRYFYFDPEYNDNLQKYDRETNTDKYGPALILNDSWNFSKNWQLDIKADLSYLFNDMHSYNYSQHSQESISNRDEDSDEIALQSAINLNWYVSTRTHLWASINYDYDKTAGDGTYENVSDSTLIKYDYDGEEQNFTLSLNAEYYLSPRLFIDFTFSLRNTKIRDEYTGWEQMNWHYDNFYPGYYLKFNYDIF